MPSQAALQGEVALYGMLALRGGEFNLLPYIEPPRRTIEGQWESLLMEAARLHDEGQEFLETEEPAPGEAEPAQPVGAGTVKSASRPGAHRRNCPVLWSGRSPL